MLPTVFADLEKLQLFILQNIHYQIGTGFYFGATHLQSSWENIQQQLATPLSSNLKSAAQQTMRYAVPIDHPSQGQRPHHKLDILFLAYHQQALSNIRLDISYFNDVAFKDFVHRLFHQFIDKFGEPSKKSLRSGKEELKFKKGKFSLSYIRNTQGLRILIK